METKRVGFITSLMVYTVLCVLTLSFALSCATAEAPAAQRAPAPVQAAKPEPAPVEVAAVPAPPPEEKKSEPAAPSRKGLDLSGAKQYKVKYRDTLSKIARRQYGGKTGAFYFPIIYEASKNVLTSPDRIIPGTVITIPDLKKNINSPEAKALVKPMLLDVAKLYETRRVHPRTVAALKREAAKL
jgi:LysM repeat protein